ncbi:MAG: right-handed parallel beta-helix repeat-containing protein [Chloroflexi bacterium]|nr:right-handed parallel beta-helix repeat-containing protein [Chloroflexota bacterium]
MRARIVLSFGFVLLSLLSSLSYPVQPAHAARTWVVTSLGDNSPWSICTAGDCTLRAAINAASNGDTITFAPSVIGTIHLITGYGGMTIDKDLTIDGPGAFNLTVSGSGGGADMNISVFTVKTGASLKLSGLSITFGWNLSGGGILVHPGGTLTVDQCSFFDNYSREDGGVLYNHGTVTITSSYFGENYAGTSEEEGYGGAICNNEDGVMSITNSTIAHNGAIVGGAIDNMGSLTIVNSTIIDNGALDTGGVFNEVDYGGIATLKNVLLADNANGNCSGIFTPESTNNLSTDGTCSPGFKQVSSEALELGAQTGIPAYFPLNDGSAAIDAGANDGCPPNDETGKPRPLDGDQNGVATCDVGAFEAWPPHYFDNAIYLPNVARN